MFLCAKKILSNQYKERKQRLYNLANFKTRHYIIFWHTARQFIQFTESLAGSAESCYVRTCTRATCKRVPSIPTYLVMYTTVLSFLLFPGWDCRFFLCLSFGQLAGWMFIYIFCIVVFSPGPVVSFSSVHSEDLGGSEGGEGGNPTLWMNTKSI